MTTTAPVLASGGTGPDAPDAPGQEAAFDPLRTAEFARLRAACLRDRQRGFRRGGFAGLLTGAATWVFLGAGEMPLAAALLALFVCLTTLIVVNLVTAARTYMAASDYLLGHGVSRRVIRRNL